MAHQIENTRFGSTREDTTVEEMDTGLTQLNMDGTQEDVRLSPKRTKKMKTEKTGEPKAERTRNITRRAAHKNGKS